MGPQLAGDPRRVARDLVVSRASNDDIKAFEVNSHAGPGIQDFKLDLTSKDGSSSPWNLFAQKIFVFWFQETKQPRYEADEIAKCFRNYFKTISKAHRDTTVSADILATRAAQRRSTTRRHEVRCSSQTWYCDTPCG